MGASQQSTFLQQKIADKKTELANLKDLQALSGGLADQMQMLADKLQTLSNGTEGMWRSLIDQNTHDNHRTARMLTVYKQLLQRYFRIGTTFFVLSTWLPVSIFCAESSTRPLTRLAMMPKPKEDEDAEAKQETEPPLPQTLVRIPTQHAPAVIEQANAGAASAAE